MTPDRYVASAGPSDPQSWNRYAYVQGDPINYLDPWGLDKCPPDSENTCVDVTTGIDPLTYAGLVYWVTNHPPTGAPTDRTNYANGNPRPRPAFSLADDAKALIDSNTSDCKALATFADALGDQSKTKDAFMQGFGILTPNVLVTQLTPGVYGSDQAVQIHKDGFASGFLSIYQDSLIPNSDQGHHFAAFFQLGYVYGPSATGLANVYEIIQGFFQRTGTNNGDVALGEAAAVLGAAVANGTLPYQDVGRSIRGLLCK